MQTILPLTTLAQWLGLSRCQRSIRGRHSLPSRNLLNISGVTRIHCVRGSLWITGGGTAEDMVVTAGVTRNFPQDSRLLIEALDDSDFEVTQS
ncbi:MAG: DUF2917 domain-containing protein [Verrucomicrobiaceae bacterium]|nr:MAG: DUF2917 domain-containing protein [Verrucomicrobiaceae bacterium]